jgi:hypothetical protein
MDARSAFLFISTSSYGFRLCPMGARGCQRYFVIALNLASAALCLDPGVFIERSRQVRDLIMDLSMGFLDRLELLGKLEAGPLFLDHGDDLVEVSVRPLEVLDEPGCTRCVMVFLTISILPPGYSYPPGWIAKAA